MAKVKFSQPWNRRERAGGEVGSSDTKTETSGFRSTTQQLARLARASATNRLAREQGYDMVQSDEEVFLSGGFDAPTYDLASVEEGLVTLRARREELSADILASEERARAIQSDLDAKAGEAAAEPEAATE